MWISWCQLFIVWVFVPLLSLHGFGGTPLHDIPMVFRDGFRCFIGDTTIPVYNGDEVTGYCSPFVPRVTMLYSTLGFLAAIFQLLILRYGSAVLMVIASAVILPLSNLAFSIEWVMGDQVEPFSYYDVGGLVLVLFGIILYRWFQIKSQKQSVMPVHDSPHYVEIDDSDDVYSRRR
jgi:CRT-like, chloroquine-resistance transporter-like